LVGKTFGPVEMIDQRTIMEEGRPPEHSKTGMVIFK
jgi:hypothetical protein